MISRASSLLVIAALFWPPCGLAISSNYVPPFKPVDFLVRATSADMPLTMRRHDWPGAGYQIGDSFVGKYGPQSIWSYPPHGKFNAANGDGGELYSVWPNGTVTIALTQDGAKPYIQKFCGGTGWIVFRGRPPSGQWASTVAYLADVPIHQPCAAALSPAYTRWRLELASIPFLVRGTREFRSIPTIISEHFDGASMSQSSHLERSFFGKGYGRLVWEAWGIGPATSTDLAVRCPGTAWSKPPAKNWRLHDCRFATNIIIAERAMSVAKFGWP